MLKLSLIAINLGAAGYALHQWREMSPGMRKFSLIICAMTFVAALPGFIEGISYLLRSFGVTYAWTGIGVFLLGLVFFPVGLLLLAVPVIAIVSGERGHSVWENFVLVLCLPLGALLTWLGLVMLGFNIA